MKKILSMLITTSILSPSAHSDDTEIFTGTSSSGGGLNVIFLLDTSGSMSQLETIPGFEDYNPSKNYENSDYDFDSSSHYIFRSGGIDDLLSMTQVEISTLKNYEIDLNQYNCRSSAGTTNIEEYGYTTGRFAFFSSNEGWSAPSSDSELFGSSAPVVNKNTSSIIQCKESDRLGGDYLYQGSDYEELAKLSYYNSTGRKYADYGSFFSTSNFYNWPSGYNIILSGNYLNYLGQKGDADNPDDTYKMRLDIVADAAKEVISANEDPNLNISLMRFSSNSEGAFVGIPLTPATEVSEAFSDEIDSYDASGGTPITESLWEAYLYLSEQDVDYGSSAAVYEVADKIYRSNHSQGTDPDDQTFSSDYGNVNPYAQYPTTYSSNSTYYTYDSNIKSAAESTENNSGSVYKLPEPGECGIPDQKIILFSDGDASNDQGANGKIQTKLSGTFSSLPSGLSFSCSGDGGCADEFAYYLASKERQVSESTPTLTIDTMGGFLDGGDTAEDLLIAIKDQGNGKYYPISSEEDVKLALAEATSVPVESPSTFTAPAIAVSSYNSLQISDELYYAVFEPNSTGAWAGNLKRYKIGVDGVLDINNKSAIESSSGFFSSTAVSYWSNTQDGANVRLGGAAEQFGNVVRNIKYIDQSGVLRSATPENILALTGDALGLESSGLTDAIFDEVDNITYSIGLANWISGLTADGQQNRLEIEDAIHSRPVVINYTEDRRVVYIGTNSGYLHAFDTETGKEVFSVIPYELLSNAKSYLNPESTSSLDKIYGLDGPITYWHDDSNLNGVVDSNESVYLYVGMRRGGHSYYAFDVTNPDNPSLKWSKHGVYTDTSKNIPSVSNGYESLGQTWSALKPVLVNYGNDTKVVLLAGGGYDELEDNSNSVRQQNTVGNTIFAIDAETGDVLWDAYKAHPELNSSMTNSFASDITPIDRNNDGYIDMLYAADTGGRIWRFDFKNLSETSGGVIADINDSDSEGAGGNRRFFVRPDVSYVKTKIKSQIEVNGEKKVTYTPISFIMISIGSGYRAHPLSQEVNDNIFIIKDPQGLSFPSEYKQLSKSDLGAWSQSTENEEYGWYVELNGSGEKVMSPSLTLNGVITINTFSTNSSEEQVSCTGNLGLSKTYRLAPTEEIRSRIKSCDSNDSCSPDIPGSTTKVFDEVQRFKPDPTLVMPDSDKDCPEGQECASSCEDYVIDILSGTTLTKGNLNRCDLFEASYWKEEI
ncbi:MAG: PilC/PilY family type IV pilus protein [Thalassolituus sp.]|jgi:type IV pilus assembly protein PilY1|uniref:pilus assembly protein n=1 Tax=Thalassolituus sp. TaxID=2030822 RepID=UPI0027D75AA2|nr:PilC/PilY family type IV pilus protein [Thalassolituus sp.]MDQ4422510.1 PilC/PilY family type IV pilus protein [Thalassolituus sp.]MDQ4425264.1 PilC/PilY family type IV pilus protein [Thalassolituus sp.]